MVGGVMGMILGQRGERGERRDASGSVVVEESDDGAVAGLGSTALMMVLGRRKKKVRGRKMLVELALIRIEHILLSGCLEREGKKEKLCCVKLIAWVVSVYCANWQVFQFLDFLLFCLCFSYG